MSHTRAKTVMLLVVLLAVPLVSPATVKPAKPSRLVKYIPNLCRRSDPELNKCMTENVKDILKFAKTGIPELSIPAFEPFVIEELDLKVFQGLSSSLFGGNVLRSEKHKAFARNLLVHHSSEFILHNLKTNLDKKEFFIDLSFPKLEIEGEYDVNLMMFNLPIKSTGPIFINATDTAVKATLNGKIVKKKNDTYLLFDSIDIKVDFKDYSIVIDKLFKKDQNLNRALNDMIRSQKVELRKLAMPMIEELAGKMVLDLINKILSSLPFEEIFLP